MRQIILPNIRKIFIPDPGYVLFDCDLSGADAQVVAWEAGDEDLKTAFRAKLDVHAKNATDMWGLEFSSLDPEGYPYYKKRQSCKHSVHGTNYGGTPSALAHHPSIGFSIPEAERFQKRWFDLHPKIGPISRSGSWHHRIQRELDAAKVVTNAFGYRRVYFDRPDQCWTEALAWVPQSTVALVTFYGALQLEQKCPWVEILLQNHDSLVFQVPTQHAHKYREIREALSVTIPYPDPLIIPWGISISEKSWGDLEKIKEGA